MEKREIERLSKYFSVLQNRVALKILFLLKKEPMYVYVITDKLKVRTAVVSKVLKLLRLINMVDYEQDSKRRRYFLKRSELFEYIIGFSELIKRKRH